MNVVAAAAPMVGGGGGSMMNNILYSCHFKFEKFHCLLKKFGSTFFFILEKIYKKKFSN